MTYRCRICGKKIPKEVAAVALSRTNWEATQIDAGGTLTIKVALAPFLARRLHGIND